MVDRRNPDSVLSVTGSKDSNAEYVSTAPQTDVGVYLSQKSVVKTEPAQMSELPIRVPLTPAPNADSISNWAAISQYSFAAPELFSNASTAAPTTTGSIALSQSTAIAPSPNPVALSRPSVTRNPAQQPPAITPTPRIGPRPIAGVTTSFDHNLGSIHDDDDNSNAHLIPQMLDKKPAHEDNRESLSKRDSGGSTRAHTLSYTSSISNRSYSQLLPFIYLFDLKANLTMINHQIKHASVIQVAGNYYLMMYSHYYPKSAPDGSSRTITHNYSADPSSKKSVLVAAKINRDCKGAIITYGFSIEAKGEQVLDVATLCLSTSASQPREPDMACYLACMEHIPQGSTTPTVALQMYNSTAKKSRILFTSKCVVHRTKSYFQLLELNDGADLMVLFLKSMTELKMVLAPADNNRFHTYFPLGPVISVTGEGIATIRDFCVDSEVDTNKLLGPSNYDEATASPAYATTDFGLVALVEKNQNTSGDPQNLLGLFRISLEQKLKIQPDTASGELKPNFTAAGWRDFECSEFGVAEKVKQQVPGCEVKVEPAKVRFCSRLKRVFLFGTAVALTSPETRTFVFVVMFCPDSPDERQICVMPRTTSPLKFDMVEIGVPKDDRHKQLMPPVDQKFMIAGNPLLGLSGGTMDFSNNPIFIFGVANDDLFYSCYLRENRLEVEDPLKYLRGKGQSVPKSGKQIKHITSISWVNTRGLRKDSAAGSNLAGTANSSNITRSSRLTVSANRLSVVNVIITQDWKPSDSNTPTVACGPASK